MPGVQRLADGLLDGLAGLAHDSDGRFGQSLGGHPLGALAGRRVGTLSGEDAVADDDDARHDGHSPNLPGRTPIKL